MREHDDVTASGRNRGEHYIRMEIKDYLPDKAASCSRSAGSFQGANTQVQKQFLLQPVPFHLRFSQDKENLYRNVSEITKRWLLGLWETPLRQTSLSCSDGFPCLKCIDIQLFPFSTASTPISHSLFSDLVLTSPPAIIAHCIPLNAELIPHYCYPEI